MVSPYYCHSGQNKDTIKSKHQHFVNPSERCGDLHFETCPSTLHGTVKHTVKNNQINKTKKTQENTFLFFNKFHYIPILLNYIPRYSGDFQGYFHNHIANSPTNYPAQCCQNNNQQRAKFTFRVQRDSPTTSQNEPNINIQKYYVRPNSSKWILIFIRIC